MRKKQIKAQIMVQYYATFKNNVPGKIYSDIINV